MKSMTSKSMTRAFMAAVPVAALVLAPAVAAAHPNNETEVTVTTYSSTVQVDIFNYHPYAIDCQTNVDGGSLLYMTVGAQATASTWHGGTPSGAHTVNWSCTSDNGTVSHSGGSKPVTVADSGTDGGSGTDDTNKKFDLCDIDFFGGFEKVGVCPAK